MADAPLLGPSPAFQRTIGRLRGAAPGPTLICVAGIHGNEPAGIHAARRVFNALSDLPRGELLVLAGNLRSLALGKRYQQRDLNRNWSSAGLAAPASGPEDLEARELHDAIQSAIRDSRGEVILLDLHTTSATGIPFAITADTLRHRAFAARFPLPVLLGLEENIDGTLSEYLTSRGHVTLVVEGGQHASPGSIDNLEAVLWMALDAAGLAPRATLRSWAAAHHHLDRVRGGLPRLIEVLDRHGIADGDAFVMEPGFANIQRIAADTLLARDRRGEIRAPGDGLVLMPLYQAQGDDGFFFGREVPAWRQRLARVARRCRLERALPLLPGVRRDAAAGWDSFDVSPRAAALFPRVFNLLGFRRLRPRGARLSVSRSPQ